MSQDAAPRVGDELPALVVGPLTPELFARYAEASGDRNPLHTDPAFARAAGLDGVIAHGMLVMGLLGRLAEGLAGPGALLEFRVRFRAPTLPGETLRCGGRVTGAYERAGRRVIEAELWARGAGEQLKAAGSAIAQLPGYER